MVYIYDIYTHLNVSRETERENKRMDGWMDDSQLDGWMDNGLVDE